MTKATSADQPTAPPRLGMMGGTFDPVHLGHLASAREVAAAFGFDRVLLVLSARPPHKHGGAVAGIEERMDMLAIATGDDALIEASDIEVRRQGPSYTVDSLEQLGRLYPGNELYLIMGIDAYLEIDSWHRAGVLLEYANLVVTTRPGTPLDTKTLEPPFAALETTCYDPKIGCYVHNSGHTLRTHDIRGLDISASEIRERVRAGLPIDDMVGATVADYIKTNQVYGVPGS